MNDLSTVICGVEIVCFVFILWVNVAIIPHLFVYFPVFYKLAPRWHLAFYLPINPQPPSPAGARLFALCHTIRAGCAGNSINNTQKKMCKN
jgi:hypothetical protein